MSAETLMRGGLNHKSMFTTDGEFFALVDATGGWPSGYRYVGFEHTESRKAGFCNSAQNTGWWTIIADVDDYYMWKLSPQALQRIANAVVSSIRLPAVSAGNLWIKNSRGHKATIAKEKTA